MNTFRYRFRSECRHDIDALLEIIPNPSRLEIMQRPLESGKQFVPPDCEVEIETELPIVVLAAFMACICDGHVMLESLALKEHYTGERDSRFSSAFDLLKRAFHQDIDLQFKATSGQWEWNEGTT